MHFVLILTVIELAINTLHLERCKLPPSTAWDVCIQMKENGLLAKPTHGNIIRFAPPLTITEAEVDQCLDIIAQSVKQVG